MRLLKTVYSLVSAFFLVSALSVSAFEFSLTDALAENSSDSDENFDRLDGHGESGKRVNVIEWEGNLEIHVYPRGSLRGLALKLDDRDQKKPVMVIGYRFDISPSKQLIRRAILGYDLKGFKAYKDKSADDYDKIVISNQTITDKDLVPYKLEPAPTQLYPDGHPSNPDPSETSSPAAAKKSSAVQPRVQAPAAPSRVGAPQVRAKEQPKVQPKEQLEEKLEDQPAPSRKSKPEAPSKPSIDEDGGIRPFFGD